jgi:hypothetical protein
MFTHLPHRRSVQFTQIANVILIAGGIACVLVLLDVVHAYAFVAERQFTSAAGVVLYCLPPSVLLFVCFGALRLAPTHKQSVSIVCLSFAILIYGAEVALMMTNGSFTPLARSASNAKVFPRRADQVDQKLAELRSSGVSAVRSIGAPVVRYEKSLVGTSGGQARAPELIALSGIARRKTIVCQDAGDWLIYDSDEHGFHNPLGLWKSDQVDIAAVGNSWTQGWCVPSDRNFVSLIRRSYPATVNLGMAGEGPLQILAIAKEYLPVLRPKVLIWFYFEGNSLRELQEEKKYEPLMRYVHSEFKQDLIGRQDEIDQAAISAAAEDRKRQREREAKERVSDVAFGTLRGLIRLTSLRNAFGLVYGTDAQTHAALEDLTGPTMELFGEIVGVVKTQVSLWGGTLVFVYLPSSERYAKWTRPTLSPDSQQRTRVLRLVADAAVPIIDLHSIFTIRGGNSVFRNNSRFNEEGNRIIAEHVLEGISPFVVNLSVVR